MNKWYVGLISLFIMIGGFIFIFTILSHPEEIGKMNKAEKAKSTKTKTTMASTPTIFVHGYGGTKNSFGSMIDRFKQHDNATFSLMMTVQENGHLTVKGDYDKSSNNPLIQLLFEDNKSSMENQTKWLKTAFKTLKKKYHINKINAVGHSMGGVSLVDYVEQTSGNKNFPILKKLVLMGAPINGLVIGKNGVTDYDLTDKGPQKKTGRFAKFMAYKERIPKNLEVFTIAGDTLDGRKSDGSVSVASALSAKFIFTYVLRYKEKVFKGSGAKHSNLHENPEIDAVLSDFLFVRYPS